MAAALRIGPASTVICGIGEFGDAVAEVLAGSIAQTVRVSSEDLESVFALRPSRVILSLWRPAPALADRVDELAHLHSVPWLPIVAEHPIVRMGPLIVPGASACHQCFAGRRIQHEPRAEAMLALYQAYDENPAYGPSGHLPHHARTAAGTAITLLGDGPRPAEPGLAITYSPVHARLAAHHVVAAHGCERCGSAETDFPRSETLANVLSSTGRVGN